MLSADKAIAKQLDDNLTEQAVETLFEVMRKNMLECIGYIGDPDCSSKSLATLKKTKSEIRTIVKKLRT